VMPSTRPALLSSSARATFFVVASGSAVCKRERPPRLRDKGGGERSDTTTEFCPAPRVHTIRATASLASLA
jgi:hypothetical protein